jgi:dihydrofolate reductase
MKIILSMAVSANGIIATNDGGEDFLSDETWNHFVRRAKDIGCVVWGRKTHEAVMSYSQRYIDDIKDVKKVVVSSSKIDLNDGCFLATSPQEAIKQLVSEGFEKILISGGSTLNAEFAKLNLIDEIILDINPVIVGSGIPLFLPTDFELKLKLKDTKLIEGGNVELIYEVIK